jgi:hypothetical protein
VATGGRGDRAVDVGGIVVFVALGVAVDVTVDVDDAAGVRDAVAEGDAVKVGVTVSCEGAGAAPPPVAAEAASSATTDVTPAAIQLATRACVCTNIQERRTREGRFVGSIYASRQ